MPLPATRIRTQLTKVNSQSPGRDVGWLRAYDRICGMRNGAGRRLPGSSGRGPPGGFACGDTIKEIAHDLRVTEGPVRR